MSTEAAGHAPAGAQEQVEAPPDKWSGRTPGTVSEFLQDETERRSDRMSGKPPKPREESADPAASGRPAGKAGAAAKGPSAADKDADERLTTRIREAVETSTAELRRQNEELRQRLEALPKAPASGGRTDDVRPAADGGKEAAKASGLSSADLAKYQAMPGAPKIDDKDAQGEYLYATAHDHAVALGVFVSEQRAGERASADKDAKQRGDAYEARVKTEIERNTRFSSRVEDWKKANEAKLVDREVTAADGTKQTVKVLPLKGDMTKIHGFAALARTNYERRKQGLEALPATVDHAIAEELYDSEIPGDAAVYLSDHPEELAELRKAKDPADLARRFGALEYRVRQTIKAPAAAAAAGQPKISAADSRRKADEAVDRSVSSAKAVERNLGRPGAAESDPEEVAVRTGNAGMFLEHERAKRQATLEAKLGARRRR